MEVSKVSSLVPIFEGGVEIPQWKAKECLSAYRRGRLWCAIRRLRLRETLTILTAILSYGYCLTSPSRHFCGPSRHSVAWNTKNVMAQCYHCNVFVNLMNKLSYILQLIIAAFGMREHMKYVSTVFKSAFSLYWSKHDTKSDLFCFENIKQKIILKEFSIQKYWHQFLQKYSIYISIIRVGLTLIWNQTNCNYYYIINNRFS